MTLILSPVDEAKSKADFYGQMASSYGEKAIKANEELMRLGECIRFSHFVADKLKKNEELLKQVSREPFSALRPCVKRVVKLQRKVRDNQKLAVEWVKKEEKAHKEYLALKKAWEVRRPFSFLPPPPSPAYKWK